jgi:enterochelin esterase family protein
VRFEVGTGTSSYAEGPEAPAEAWLASRADVRKGNVTSYLSTSAALSNSTREISVYTPAGYSPRGSAYPLVLIFDREAYLQTLDVPTLLDNMIGAGVIPPVVAAFVSNVDRSTELPSNPVFAKFIAEELLPELRGKYHLRRDGARNVIAGASYGGLAATYIAYNYPKAFGNVLSQSGSYWWHPGYETESEDQFARNWNWLPRQVAGSRRLPIKFYLDVGLWEGAGMLTPNRTFRDLLQAKGYDVTYREFVGAHTYLNWRATFPEALISLIGNAHD